MSQYAADYAEYVLQDALDRRAALVAAAGTADTWSGLLERADMAYVWLRARTTVQPARLTIIPGVPENGGNPVALALDMTDVQSDTFTLAPVDAKGFAVPDGPYTWAEDSAGAVITIVPSADGSSVVATAVAPGVATLTVTDPTGLQGTEAVTVTPGPVAAIGIVAGTPA